MPSVPVPVFAVDYQGAGTPPPFLTFSATLGGPGGTPNRRAGTVDAPEGSAVEERNGQGYVLAVALPDGFTIVRLSAERAVEAARFGNYGLSYAAE